MGFLISLLLILTFRFCSEAVRILLVEYNFFVLRGYRLRFVLLLDTLSVIFLFTVGLITTAVLVFRHSYMAEDKYFFRFHILLLLFVLRIFFLILRPNLVGLLLGWDGLGLTSYLLVVYYGNSKAYNSGMVTALSNRLGDAFLLVAISYLVAFGNWNYWFYSNASLAFIRAIIALTATTKRAQIPFSAWLPAAIAAPTPVSSLVHSSTLVTAGVYLIIRHRDFWRLTQVREYLLIIGSLTIIIARVRALFETDLKKMVALSTLSQLGVIVLRLGLGAFLARFFHLLSHAFFKALLFLGTGSIIHNRKDYQDLRMVGGGVLPVTHRVILLARIRLIGVPFMSAFFSKEIVLELILVKNFNVGSYLFMLTGILLTAAYRSRFILFVFTRSTNGGALRFNLDEDKAVVAAMLLLLIPASCGGVYLRIALFSRPVVGGFRRTIKLVILSLLILGITIRRINLSPWKRSLNRAVGRLGRLWSLPRLSTRPALFFYKGCSRLLLQAMDRGLFAKIFGTYYNLFGGRRLYNSSLLSILKIVNLFFVWGLVAGLYYLCNLFT